MRKGLLALAVLLCAQGIALAQTDMTGFWKFSVPNGGLNYMELKQTGETVTTTGGRRVMTGTLHDGKLHLEIVNGENSTVIEATVKGEKFTAVRTTKDGPWEASIQERWSASPKKKPTLLACLCPSCANCPITASSALRLWAGIAGISSMTTSTTLPFAAWPTPW